MKKILVTGASGFIGNALCKSLVKNGNLVYGTVRSVNSSLAKNSKIEYIPTGDISLKSNWKSILNGIDCVIHCAGMAHKVNKWQDLNEYLATNKEGTRYLAEQAADAGVRRFIFLSSIGVNGKSTYNIDKSISLNIAKKKIFKYDDIPNPKDYYSISKLEAEKVLLKISAKSNLDIVIVRLPLVYGRNSKGNFDRLIKIIKIGIPLPLGMVQNQRSVIGINNLIDLLIQCIDHPNAIGKTFLASDNEDLSTCDLIKLIASSMGKTVRLFPVPLYLLKFAAIIIGRQKDYHRLTESLRVDSSYVKKMLGWKPPLTTKEEIEKIFKDI